MTVELHWWKRFINVLKQSKKPGLNSIVVIMAKEFIDMAIDQGLNVDVFSGYRSFKEQNALYAKGRTKPGNKVTNAKGGQSWHNYGLAVDVVFYVNGKPSWEEYHDWEKLGRIGKLVGFEWGGDWKKRDRPHFQYTMNMDTKTALKLYKTGGLELVWSHLKE